MKAKLISLVIFTFFLTIIFYASGSVSAQEPANCPPDKALCAKMLRFGKQAYARGKYLDAKEYFRNAVKADPSSITAWRYYDQSVIFGLAEKVEKNGKLILPDVSTRHESAAGVSPQPPPPPQKSTSEKKDQVDFKIVDDEGC